MAEAASKRVRYINFLCGDQLIPVSWVYNGKDALYVASEIEDLLRTELSAGPGDTLQFKSTSGPGALLKLVSIADLVLEGRAHEHTELDEETGTLKVNLLVKKAKAPASRRGGSSTTTDSTSGTNCKLPPDVHKDLMDQIKAYWPRIGETQEVYNESEGTKTLDWEKSVYKGQLVKPSDSARRWPPMEEAMQSFLLAKHGDKPNVTASTLNRNVSQIISNNYNTPVTRYYKQKAGITVSQPATEKRLQELETAAETWKKKYGGIYNRRTEEQAPLPNLLATQLHKVLNGQQGNGGLQLVKVEKTKTKPPGAAPGSDQQQQQRMETEEAEGRADSEADDGLLLLDPDHQQQQQEHDSGPDGSTPDQPASRGKKGRQDPASDGSATATERPAVADKEKPQAQRRAARLADKASAKAEAEAKTANAAAANRGSSGTPQRELNSRAQQALNELKRQIEEGGASPGMLALLLGNKPGLQEAVNHPSSASVQQLRQGLGGKKLPQAETAEQRERRLKGDREADAKAAKPKRNKAAGSAGGQNKGDAAAGAKGRGRRSNSRGGGNGKDGGAKGGDATGGKGSGGRKRKAHEVEEEEELSQSSISEEEEELSMSVSISG